ncbi:hypothetical protein FRB99_003313 [Tulasnella sp. 403]|nr:hypothetical protein FRB99_003313 [Tulasnella sp. 403]
MAAPVRSSFVIQNDAYLKFFIHAAKFPHAAVNGFLLGSKVSDEDGEHWVISDAVPLLHHWTNLSPMMEIGLELVQIYAKDAGLTIIGFYEATEKLLDVEVSAVGRHILEQLSKDFPPAFAFVFNASNILQNEPALKVSMLLRQPTKPSDPSDKFDLEDEAILRRSLRAAREGNLRNFLCDFDDFLEDGSVDWPKNAAITIRS